MANPGTRPLTRAQQMENAAFLRALRRTGNAREAARSIGAYRAKFTKRRAKHPRFAAEWDAALVIAHGALRNPRKGIGHRAVGDAAVAGEAPRVHRLKSGRLQLRRAQAGRLDHAARQRFLAALSACANVRLAAAAAGFTHAAFYRHKRTNPAFAREWLMALQDGYWRLEMALLESGLPEAFTDDDWRRNEPPALPPMTNNQALQLMYLHQKEARLWSTPFPEQLRPGETHKARSVALGMIYDAKLERDRMAHKIAEAERLAAGKPTFHRWEPGELPDLSQVTGWSKAKDKPPTDPKRALFGGWRLGDWKRG